MGMNSVYFLLVFSLQLLLFRQRKCISNLQSLRIGRTYTDSKEKWRMLKSRNIQTKETQRNSIFKPNNILSGNSELRFARF